MRNLKIIPNQRNLHSFSSTKGYRLLNIALLSICVILFLKKSDTEKNYEKLEKLLIDKEEELNNLISEQKVDTSIELPVKNEEVEELKEDVKPVPNEFEQTTNDSYYKTLFEIEKGMLTEFIDFDFTSLHNRTSAEKLTDMIPKFEGTPIINVIIASSRSGSNFMEDFINSFPGTYRHHEILTHFGQRKFTNDTIEKLAAAEAVKMMHCNYDELDSFLAKAKLTGGNRILNSNSRVWEYVQDGKRYSKQFLNDACRIFPVQAFKINRLHLKFSETFLEDATLNLRMLFLFRDPRGMISSRLSIAKTRNKVGNWSATNELKLMHEDPYYNPVNVCKDLEDDLEAANQLLKKYPNRFTIVRYEDFGLNTFETARNITNFLGLPFHEKMQEFVETHTHLNRSLPITRYTTYRNSNDTVFHWKKEMTYEAIEYIQLNCETALSKGGFIVANNKSELQGDFIPIKEINYKISEYFN